MTVYSPTRAYCQFCDQLKTWLRDHDVPFREVKTDQFESYPRTQIGEAWIRGYNTDAIAQALDLKPKASEQVKTTAGTRRVIYMRPAYASCRSCR